MESDSGSPSQSPGINERGINGRFRLMAEVRYNRCPSWDDHFSWLFLMQHYRLPTRLLDWSESPLTALFFALENDSANDNDALVWALRPDKLNFQQLGSETIFVPGMPEVMKLAYDAFSPPRVPNPTILAVQPTHSDLRHMVQQSMVTIHGGDVRIDELPESDSHLARIRIPAADKNFFRDVMRMYGISRSTLFPDLENLAQELVSLKWGSNIADLSDGPV